MTTRCLVSARIQVFAGRPAPTLAGHAGSVPHKCASRAHLLSREELPMRCLLTLVIAALIPAVAARAQDAVKERLEKSPRHLEWVKVKHDAREVKCFIAFPEVKDKATAVVVIHEIFGLSDWVRGVTD